MAASNETTSMISLIMNADDADLGVLADYITDRGKGRLALDGDVCRALVAARTEGKFGVDERTLLATEILQFGGNTISNFFRGVRQSVGSVSLLDSLLPSATPTIPYDEIVHDVAARMKVAIGKRDSVPSVEAAIIQHVLTESLAKMDAEGRRTMFGELAGRDISVAAPALTLAALAGSSLGGFATYRMAVIVANSVARTMTGRGLSLLANATVTRSLGIALGPIGWAVTGLWTVADLASPAYRVTVPCVIHVAYLRQKSLNRDVAHCEFCSALLVANSRFCAECGKPIEAEA